LVRLIMKQRVVIYPLFLKLKKWQKAKSNRRTKRE